MSARLVVDGHNVIFRTERLAASYGRDPQGTRARLVRDLAVFGARKGYDVTVVFDAGRGGTSMRSSQEEAGVEVLYARSGETADEFIEEVIESAPRGEPVFVVSSDRGVQQRARAHRAVSWGVDELFRKMAGPQARSKPSDWHPIEHGVKGYTGED